MSQSPNFSVRRTLARGAVGGAVLFSLWFFGELFAYSGFEIMGESDSRIKELVESNYFWLNIGYQALILLSTAFAGALAGALSGFYSYRFGGGRITLYGLPVIVWAAVQLRLVVRQPQFFDGAFLDQRPVLKEIIFAPTRWLDPMAADFILLGVALILLSAPVISVFGWLIASKVRIAVTAAIALLTAALLPLDGGPAPSHASLAGKRNVVLIVVDSLRADHLSMLGYGRNTTPVIDSLAGEGAVFTKVIVDVPRTFPSWVSMMTGVYPMSHGVRHMFPTVEQRRLVQTPLPRALAVNGWKTAVVSDFAGDIFPRIDFGFDDIDTPDLTFGQVVKMRNLEIHPASLAFLNNRMGQALFPAIRELAYNCDPEALTDRAIGKLKSFEPGQPFALAVFYSATHMPYAASGPSYRMFTDPGYKGRHRFQKKNLLMKSDDDTPEDVNQIIGLFDGALNATDRQIGRIVSAIEEMGLSGDTAIVITGDHGENFFEYRAEIGHGNHLRGPHAITAPVVIRAPWIKPSAKKIEWQARIIDLAPTIAELVGESSFKAEGKSLVPFITGEEKGHRMAYSESGLWYLDEGPFFFQKNRIHYPGVTSLCEVDMEWRDEIVLKNRYQSLVVAAKHRMISDGERKLIVMPTESGVVTELYDLKNDPAETVDISQKEPVTVSVLQEKLHSLVSGLVPTTLRDGYIFERARPVW
ncbi:MAG: sulfatase [Nitrospinae bacterium]|nr:sulfatase [Nitrospinota bacterium]MBF0633295.1 sulfatase [Nitrospinota bacterium]